MNKLLDATGTAKHEGPSWVELDNNSVQIASQA